MYAFESGFETMNVPFALSAAIASSSSIEACSMERTPARAARRMPSVPCACTATSRPFSFAASTAARISSSVYSACRGSVFAEPMPPVTSILIQSAPYLTFSRTFFRISSGPSAIAEYRITCTSSGRSLRSPCPPVAEMDFVATSMRGPTTLPAAISSRSATSAKSRAPRSRTVVKPASIVFRALTTPSMAACAVVSVRVW